MVDSRLALLTIGAALGTTVAGIEPARPCTPIDCVDDIVVPRDGAVVPANLPGLRLIVGDEGEEGGPTAEDWVRPEDITVSVVDDEGRVVATEPDGPHVLFVEPLEPGRRYEVTVDSLITCRGRTTSAFTTVEAQPLPDALGEVVPGSITVTDHDTGPCSDGGRVYERRVALRLDPSARPWADALAVRFFVEGQPAPRSDFWDAVQTSRPNSSMFARSIRYVCDDTLADSFGTRAPGGVQRAQAGGVIAGAWGERTESTEVFFDCSAGGCRAAPLDRAAVLLVLAATLWMLRRRRST